MNLTKCIGTLLAAGLCAVLTIGTAFAHQETLRVRIGDRLSIHVVGIVPTATPSPNEGSEAGTAATVSQTSPSEPTFLVLSDGSIQSHDFGILHVEGLTIPEVAKAVHDRLAEKFKNPIVSVVLASEAPYYLFLSGVKEDGGAVKLLPGEDLRRLLASATMDREPDLSEAHVFRAGQPERTANVQDVLNGTSPLASFKLQPNDVVTVLPLRFIRVWVTGEVEKPGQVPVHVGDDVYRAIATAGGALSSAIADGDTKIGLRRGPNTTYLPIKQDPSAPLVPLEPGDTIVVASGNRIRVTVSGEVKLPGNIDLRTGALLDQAIAGAGGLTAAGTGRSVMVLRDGKTYTANVASSTNPQGLGSFKLQNQDVVLVRQNTAYVIAVGYVGKQGRVYIPDGQTMHLIDVIGDAGGIVDKGTPRHVFVGHPDQRGVMHIREVRLDRYMKNGDPEGNPVMAAGDIVTVQPAQAPTLDVVQQLLSGALVAYGVSQI